jgi:ABC-type polysaccharide/polyol phosphate transport system ATPase subunit
MKPILEVEDLWLAYRVSRRRHQSLKAAILNSLRGRGMGETTNYEALRGVSFTLGRGEVMGVCGRNGGGKSSLLRALAGIQRPTRGTIIARGRIGSILTLTGGFHPESTGRDNVYLSCLLMGLSPREAAERMEAILEFAELGDFLDAPVRTYSTGMRARLGFAIAAHLEADALLVDEILSVGDAGFERKCERWLQERLGAGASMVLVSHDLEAIRRLCHRALWLDQGQVRLAGPAEEVIAEYRAYFQATATAEAAS